MPTRQTLLLLLAAAALAFKYPAAINDTSSQDDPSLLAVSEVELQYVFANRVVQLRHDTTNSSFVDVVIDPASSVGLFKLVKGTLQIDDGRNFTAKLTPLPTEGGVLRRKLQFGQYSDPGSNWLLISVSNNGLFELLNSGAAYDNINGFVVCKSAKNSYTIEYQSSKNGINTSGCFATALHTNLGPSFPPAAPGY